MAPSPPSDGTVSQGHLRWHPLLGEWVSYAGHRQHRTFLPPATFDPLAPSNDRGLSTEVPAGNWDVAVFENLFPAFSTGPNEAPHLIVETRPAQGVCEVVVFTQEQDTSLGALPLERVRLVLDVLADRYEELGRRDDVQYVYPFENRGVEVGVTLHHPHGQIYAYPFVPPLAALELTQQRRYYEQHQRGLLEDHVAGELQAQCRLLYSGSDVVAFVPVCARYAYEVWILPRRPAASLVALAPSQRTDLARGLKTVLMKFDRLWSGVFPYVMVFHQAPTDGQDHPEAHVHIELYPAYRMPGRLKYLAGSELGAGVFTSDTLPEEKAAELQAVEVNPDV